MKIKGRITGLGVNVMEKGNFSFVITLNGIERTINPEKEILIEGDLKDIPKPKPKNG